MIRNNNSNDSNDDDKKWRRNVIEKEKFVCPVCSQRTYLGIKRINNSFINIQ